MAERVLHCRTRLIDSGCSDRPTDAGCEGRLAAAPNDRIKATVDIANIVVTPSPLSATSAVSRMLATMLPT